MNLDEIEDLIRRYLSAGITVVIILAAPATGSTDEDLAPGEPSVVTIDPDRPELDGTLPDPRVPDEDEAPEPDPAEDGRSPDEDPTDTEQDQRRPADDAEQDADPTRDDDADPIPSRDPDDDDRETDSGDDPPVDQDEVRDDETDDSSPVDEPPAPAAPAAAAAGGDAAPAEADDAADEEPAEDELVEDRNAEDRNAEDRNADEDAADPSDARTDDPDLESRGPADGSEPGIDDEPTERADGQEPATDDPAADDPTVDDSTADDSTADDSAADTREATGSGPASATEGATAAERYGWGTPDREDDFGSGLAQWDLYDGPGHAGEGLRSPDAVTVQDGVLTITGDAEGTTGGMTWTPGQRYGRWEGRVRAPASDPSYNAVLLLWPDADDFPEGGEIDFMEMLDPTRQSTDFFLHHGPDNDQVTAQVEIDGTEWHNWAAEWTPEEIVGYVDGEEWFRTTDTATFPPGPMHLCIQLDWFPDGAGEVQESTMEVDWVRQYALDPEADQPAPEVASTEPASVAVPAASAEPADDPLRRMFSWS